MTVWQSIALGVIQGLTEFLPVSSSGHLVILQSVLGLQGMVRPESLLMFNVLLHAATLAAVILYFRATALSYLREPRVLGYILVATIPTGIIGLLIERHAPEVFESPVFCAIMLLVTGGILFAAENRYTRLGGPSTPADRLGWLRSLAVGTAQGIAVLPGISRSGATVSALMAMRMSKSDAVPFTFLMSIPAISGITLLKVREALRTDALFDPVMLWGMGAAFLTGLTALHLFATLFRIGKMRSFSYYCWVVGVLVIARHLLRLRG